MKKLLISIFILFAVNISAQEKMPELITDRPDQTESSVVVPRNSMQIETGFVMENDKTSLTTNKAFAYNTTLLRYGLLENLELRLGLEYLGEAVKSRNTNTTNAFSGLSPLYTGFKIKVMNEENWKPEIAFLGAMLLPFTAEENFKPEYTATDIRFAFSHHLSERFSLGYNLGAEWDGETAIPSYFYSISFGIGITNRIGMFIESYGLLPEEGKAEHLLDTGLTYLILPNFQLDISGGIGIQNSIDNFISLGFSYRLPD